MTQYFVYILYFDQVDHKRFGTIRQQFWALCHFPFHVSLVLLMEGTSRFVTWRNALEVVKTITAEYEIIYAKFNTTAEIGNAFDTYSTKLLSSVKADLAVYNVTSFISDIKKEKDPQSEKALSAVTGLLGTLINATFKFFKIQASKRTAKTDDKKVKNPIAELDKVVKVFDLVFIYFFVAAGVTLIIMAVLIALAKKGKCAGDYAAIILRLLVGVALTMITVVKANPNLQDQFLFSAWILPSVLLGLFIVVLLDGIFGWILPAPKKLWRPNTQITHHG